MGVTLLGNIALALIAIGCTLALGPHLPATVASRFDFSGHPTASMDRGGYLLFNLLFPLILAVIFSAAAAAIAWSAGEGGGAGTPGGSVQAGELKNTRCRRRMSSEGAVFLRWTGWATLVLFIVLECLIYLANLSDPPRLRGAWPVLAAYLLFVLGMIVRLAAAERRYRGESAAPLPPGVWFPAKRIGWGWGLPIRWQGWIFLLGWVAAFTAGLILVMTSFTGHAAGWLALLAFVASMTALLVGVCWWKGERPQWR